MVGNQGERGVPIIPNATVARDGLLDRLRALGSERLLVVSAAAGSGKSALVAAWVGELDHPVAWFGCTEADGDHHRFWARLERTLVGAFADAGMMGAEVLDGVADPSPAERIVAQLATLAGPATVVVDDLHLAGASSAELVTLIASMPPRVRLVLLTRVDPPFSLARMRVQGTVAELRQADLSFTPTETALALDALGLELTDAEVAQLHALTEGWPAGVHLVGLALRDRRDRPHLLSQLAVGDRNLADFLVTEVVDRQRPEVRDFLLVTAQFDAFDATTYDAATGRRDGVALLDEVRAGNLFLVELDDDRLRYHHLFQEFLRLRLAAEAPERREAVLRGAAAACLAAGDAGEAIRHLLDAGALDEARAVLAEEITEAGTVVAGEQGAVARRWLAAHGEAQLADDPSGLLECTMALNVAGAGEEAERWLRRWQDRELSLDHEPRVLLHGAWSFHHLLAGDPERCLLEAQRAQALIDASPIADGWMASLPLLTLQAHQWLGDAGAMRATLDAARARGTGSDAIALVRMRGFAAAAELEAGAVRVADALAAQAIEAADQLALPPLNFGRGEPELVRAEVAIEAGRMADAEAHLEATLRIAEAGRRQLEVLAHLAATRLALAGGDLDRADDALARARAVFAAPSSAARARIEAVAVEVALRRGDRTTAGRLLADLPRSSAADRLRARLALEAGDAVAAAELLAAAEPDGASLRARLEHGLLAARARPRSERTAAVGAVAELLAVAAAEGYWRTVIDEGPALWDLVAEVPAVGELATYVDGVLAAARQVLPPPKATEAQGLIDPLSERELTVLRYLASRLDSSEIAEALFVSVNTVRTHVKAIYRKLDVNARPAAVARGRELGLL